MYSIPVTRNYFHFARFSSLAEFISFLLPNTFLPLVLCRFLTATPPQMQFESALTCEIKLQTTKKGHIEFHCSCFYTSSCGPLCSYAALLWYCSASGYSEFNPTYTWDAHSQSEFVVFSFLMCTLRSKESARIRILPPHLRTLAASLERWSHLLSSLLLIYFVFLQRKAKKYWLLVCTSRYCFLVHIGRTHGIRPRCYCTICGYAVTPMAAAFGAFDFALSSCSCRGIRTV